MGRAARVHGSKALELQVVEGMTLAQVLEKDGPLEIKRSAVRAAASSLRRLHAGLIQREGEAPAETESGVKVTSSSQLGGSLALPDKPYDIPDWKRPLSHGDA